MPLFCASVQSLCGDGPRANPARAGSGRVWATICLQSFGRWCRSSLSSRRAEYTQDLQQPFSRRSSQAVLRLSGRGWVFDGCFVDCVEPGKPVVGGLMGERRVGMRVVGRVECMEPRWRRTTGVKGDDCPDWKGFRKVRVECLRAVPVPYKERRGSALDSV